MSKLTPIFVLLALAVVVALSSVFIIDERELAIVTQFGEYKRSVVEPGLYFKTPFVQTVNRMERRILGSDNPPSSYLTRDKKRLVVDPITRWRIVDPLLFYTTVRDEVGAKARLDDVINSELRRALAQSDFGDVVCVPEPAISPEQRKNGPQKPGDSAKAPGEPAEKAAGQEPGGKPVKGPREATTGERRDEQPAAVPEQPDDLDEDPPDTSNQFCGREAAMAAVTKSAVEKTEKYGILVLDVRMKRTDLPTEVQESVFQRMKAERERVAKRYRSEGEEEAQKIRATTDKEVRILLAQAYQKGQTLRGRGDAESTRTYAEAYDKDPEFYAFLRSLDTYEKAVDAKSTMVLSTGSPLFKYLVTPQSP